MEISTCGGVVFRTKVFIGKWVEGGFHMEIKMPSMHGGEMEIFGNNIFHLKNFA